MDKLKIIRNNRQGHKQAATKKKTISCKQIAYN